MRMQRFLSVLVVLVSVCFGGSAPPPHQQAHVFDATVPQRRVRLSYLLFVPASYATTPETRWPLILYLHGGSLRGVPERATREHQANPDLSRCHARNGIGFSLLGQHRAQPQFAGAPTR